MVQGPSRPCVRVLASPSDVARAAATLVARLGRVAAGARGRFTLVLAGGATPRATYETLAGHPVLGREVPWAVTDVFFGDERHVPPDHPASNFGMAHAALLRHVPLDPARVHRIEAGQGDPAVAASDYEARIRSVLALGADESPAFDLVLLGVGRDGHTASIFPGSPALDERTRLVLAPFVPALGACRITMTPRVLLAARAVAVLVTGDGKAAVLREILEGPFEPARLPAQVLRRASGEVTWLVDAAAAREIVP